MADINIHLDIIEESLGEAEREIQLMRQHGHTWDNIVSKAFLSMKLIAGETKKKISKMKGDNL